MNVSDNPNKVKKGAYTVTYQTKVTPEYVKDYNANDVVTQTNDAAWSVGGKSDDGRLSSKCNSE
jgi:hypothetical protein